MATTINVKELESRIEDMQKNSFSVQESIGLHEALSWEQTDWLAMVHNSMDKVGGHVSDMVTPLERDSNRTPKMDRLGNRVSGWVAPS